MTTRSDLTIPSLPRARALPIVLALAALPSLMGAQSPWSLRVQADNDAFNFWQQPEQRPDAEYSNGVRISFSSARAPLWGARFAPRLAPCTGDEQPDQYCLSTTFSIGQNIYTPQRKPYSYDEWRDQRPYAGWLYGSMTARIGSSVSQHSAELQLGLTGPGSLGEFAQKTAHQIASYEAETQGWETQIGSEAGLVLAYQYSRRILDLTSRGRRMFDVIPVVGASVGNVLTAAEGGLRARFGVNLSDPWQPPLRGAHRHYELYAFAGARRQLVAHNIFLDGNTFGATRRVDRVPIVDAWEAGIGARFGRLTMAYQAATRTREYRTGPSSHTFGSLIAGIEM